MNRGLEEGAPQGPGRAALRMEAGFGITGVAITVLGMALGFAAPAPALPRGASALLGALLHGQSAGFVGLGLWLLVLAPVAAVAAGAAWAIKARRNRTVLFSLVALAAIALAAFFLPS